MFHLRNLITNSFHTRTDERHLTHRTLLNISRVLQRVVRRRPDIRIRILRRNRPQHLPHTRIRLHRLQQPDRRIAAHCASGSCATASSTASRTCWSCPTYCCRPSSAFIRTPASSSYRSDTISAWRIPLPSAVGWHACPALHSSVSSDTAFIRTPGVAAAVRPHHQQIPNLRAVQRPFHRLRNNLVVVHLHQLRVRRLHNPGHIRNHTLSRMANSDRSMLRRFRRTFQPDTGSVKFPVRKPTPSSSVASAGALCTLPTQR